MAEPGNRQESFEASERGGPTVPDARGGATLVDATYRRAPPAPPHGVTEFNDTIWDQPVRIVTDPVRLAVEELDGEAPEPKDRLATLIRYRAYRGPSSARRASALVEVPPTRRAPRWRWSTTVLSVALAGALAALFYSRPTGPASTDPVPTTRIPAVSIKSQESKAQPPAPPAQKTVPLRVVSVDSIPQGAFVAVNGEGVGTTPLTLRRALAPSAPIRLQVTKPGYEPWNGTVEANPTGDFSALIQLYADRTTRFEE